MQSKSIKYDNSHNSKLQSRTKCSPLSLVKCYVSRWVFYYDKRQKCISDHVENKVYDNLIIRFRPLLLLAPERFKKNCFPFFNFGNTWEDIQEAFRCQMVYMHALLALVQSFYHYQIEPKYLLITGMLCRTQKGICTGLHGFNCLTWSVIL